MKVLLVEDDAHLAASLRRGLTAEGFTVDTADDGTDGLWLGTEGAYDVVVLDVMLPGIDGFEVCRRLRAADIWTPVLMLTARDTEQDEATGLGIGADDYLTKPFSFVLLVARLRALARRAANRDPQPVCAGDLLVDPGRRRAWRMETEIPLTARQFDVLEFLVRRPDQVLSKQQILDGVWSFEFAGDPNIVEVYIRRLRAKIDEPFGRHSIQTVRGAGYRLVPGS